MAFQNASLTGTVVAEPEFKQISDKFSVLEFPVYSNRRFKDRDGAWQDDPNGVTKVKVVLKFDLIERFRGKIGKGDFIKVTGSFYERGYETKDGAKGRSLESDYVQDIEIIRSKSGNSDGGFTPDAEVSPWT